MSELQWCLIVRGFEAHKNVVTVKKTGITRVLKTVEHAAVAGATRSSKFLRSFIMLRL